MKFDTAFIALWGVLGSPVALANDQWFLDMLRLGLVQETVNCMQAFPDLREKLESDFNAFAKSNSSYVSIEQWHETEKTLAARKDAPSKDGCSSLFQRNTDFDKKIAQVRGEEINQRRIEEIIAKQKEARSVLGVGFSEKRSPYIAHVVPNSPAESAGLKVDDIIIRLNEQVIESASQFTLAILMTKPEEVVKVSILRGTQLLSLSVTVTTANKLQLE